ncbi:MAG: CoA-disulfide reductase [Oscillospiraceae bacterium]
MPQKLIVIGAVAAGLSAASKARRIDSGLDITVYTDEEYISYAGCGLPYFIGGSIQSKDMLFARSLSDFAAQNISVKTLHRVVEIRPGESKVIVRDLKKNADFDDYYDKLVIATGARPVKPSIDGIGLDGVFTLRSVSDSLKIKDYMRRHGPKNVTIVGGGYIGLEMTESFVKNNCHVTIIGRSKHIIPNMDEDMANIVRTYLESGSVTVYTEENVKGLSGNGRIRMVSTDRRDIPSDLVLLSTGVAPNSELAGAAGIELGVKNAVRVNEKCETNLENIYAAGDCAATTHLVTGREAYIPMGTTANKQGRTAGENAAGGGAAFYGVVGTGIARVMDMELSRTGLSERECAAAGIEFISRKIKSRTAAHYCPSSREMHLKLIAEKDTRRLIGGQIVGYSGAAMRIDMLATAITMGATVEQLLNMDLAYSPPFSPVWDPVLIALNQF